MNQETYSEMTCCPTCGHTKKVVERRLNETLLLYLIEFCDLFFIEKKEIKYDRVFETVRQKYRRRPSDYSILEDWGLMRKCGPSGFWKPTAKSYEFLYGRLTLPRSYTEIGFNKIEFSEDHIHVSDIIKEKIAFSWAPVQGVQNNNSIHTPTRADVRESIEEIKEAIRNY